MKKNHIMVFILVLSSFFMFGIQDKKADLSDIKDKIDQYMERVKKNGFSGSLLVSINNNIILSRGYGMSNRDKKIPITENTVFTIGSITKQFTAAAILKLQMMGKLNVRDNMTKYLGDMPDDKKNITLHHLLTHTAGFPGAIGSDFDPVEKDQFIKLVKDTKLIYNPGEKYKYSNVGYSLLGIIVELVSGKSYEVFLRNNLFKPAKMKNTGYLFPVWKKDQLAHGYRGDQDWGTLRDRSWASDGPGWHLRANGGILSTLRDMYLWHLALKGEKILNKEVKKLYYTPHIPEDEEGHSHYGYGWAIFETSRNTRLIAHDGGNSIFAADFLRYLDENVVIIVFSNTAGKPAFKVSKVIARIVFGEKYALPLKSVRKFSHEELKNSKRGIRVLALINCLGKSTETAENFIKEHIKPEMAKNKWKNLVSFLTQENGPLGEVEMGSAIQKEENSLEVKIRALKTGEWWMLTVGFENKSPFQIGSIFIDSTEPPENINQDFIQNLNKKWGLPDSLTGRKSALLLETLLRNNDTLTKKFIENYYNPQLYKKNTREKQLQQIKKWQTQIGTPELLSARKTGPYSAELKVRSKKTGKLFRLILQLEQNKPHLIKSIHIEE